MQIGLTSKEAQVKLSEVGPNVLYPEESNKLLKEILHIFKDPMGLMLLGLSAIYYFIGEINDAIVLLFVFIPVALMDVGLGLRTERALRVLKKSFQENCHVIRNGKVVNISIIKIVPGDVVVFEEGMHIPADGLILKSDSLMISEASLTGESLPLFKVIDDEFYAGTEILSGTGLGLVTTTGLQTRFGSMASTLLKISEAEGPLYKQIKKVVRIFFLIAIGVSVSLFIYNLYQGLKISSALIGALTLAMSAIPEEFSIVYTIMLSVGAFRFAKKGMLVRNLPAVETLGRVNVLCTDKTGTLTEGKFKLVKVEPFGNFSEIETDRFLRAACEPHITDSMEKSIESYLSERQRPNFLTNENWTLARDYPFDAKRKRMTHVWTNEGNNAIIAMKGAWETVSDSCHLAQDEIQKINDSVSQASSKGYRVLALAGKKDKVTFSQELDEADLDLIAIIYFTDPIRKSVPNSIKECATHNIEVKMITGDHLLTAHSVAEQIGLYHEHDKIYSGSDLDLLNADEKTQAYLNGNIFARTRPEHKYELVKSLKEAGKIVAMTGDGVNDLMALKIADVGISMGKTATSAARSVAKIILFDEDFSKLSFAIIEGRKIFSNLKSSFSYLISFHIPIILLSLLGPILNIKPLLQPIHLVLFEFLVHPISTFGFLTNQDSGEKNINQASQSFLLKIDLIKATILGILLSVVCSISYFSYLSQGERVASAALVFQFLIGNVVLLVIAKKTIKESMQKFYISIFTLLTVIGIVFIAEPIRNIFKINYIHNLNYYAFIVNSLVFFLIGKLIQKFQI